MANNNPEYNSNYVAQTFDQHPFMSNFVSEDTLQCIKEAVYNSGQEPKYSAAELDEWIERADNIIDYIANNVDVFGSQTELYLLLFNTIVTLFKTKKCSIDEFPNLADSLVSGYIENILKFEQELMASV